jgi:protein required for attachment to host cells
MKKIHTCILIADGGHAKFFLNDGVKKGLSLMNPGVYNNDHHLSEIHDTESDRHITTPRTNLHEHEKKEFAAKIAEITNKKCHDRLFDRLVLVAPAKTFHEIKEHLSHEAKKLLYAEVHKDLTKTPIEKIPEILEDFIVL